MRITLFTFTLLTACLFGFISTAQAIEFEWQDGAGKTHTLADYKGQPMILHIWASWCPPCRTEMPGLEAWIKAHPDVQIAAVSIDNRIADAAAFLSNKGINLPVLKADSANAARLGIRGLPTTIILDADGKIIKTRIGALDWDDKQTSDDIMAALQHP